MTNALDDRPTTAERYATATVSGNLTPLMTGTTDADVLLAAGIAASKDPRRMLALKLYRMAVQNSTVGLWEVVAEADGWVAQNLLKQRRRPMTKPARQQLIVSTLHWWLAPVCGYCNGTGFVEAMVEGTDEGAGRLTTAACSGCHGSGRRPLQREVPPPLYPTARWITGELDRLVALIHNDMAKLLGQRLDF